MPARRGGSRLAVLTALALLLAPAAARAQSCTMPRKPAGLVPASVVRVVDGDTIVVHPSDKLRRDAQRTGKDAAAIQALGARASEFTRKHLAGRTIDLERDATALDRYGRTLAYVWLGGDLYNLVIVREGYAGLLTIPPNVKYAGTLAACHRTAREARRGLWAAGE